MGAVEGVAYTGVKVNNTAVKGSVKICAPSQGHIQHFSYAFWIPPMIIETISVILVLYKAIRHFQKGPPKEWAGSRFMQSIARYSVIYFVVVLTVYIANFYIWLRLPIPAFELVIPLTFALPAIVGNRMLLSLRALFYSDHSLVPGQEHIRMKVVNQYENGITVETEYNPYKEFESFFGERSSRGGIIPGFSLK